MVTSALKDAAWKRLYEADERRRDIVADYIEAALKEIHIYLSDQQRNKLWDFVEYELLP